ncbi:MAG TPA: hypothetical protein PK761_08995, partial [Clostridia bacterium]|nr:hypothetical protein [Clostridia bacterium]
MNKIKLLSLVLCLVLVCSFVFTACDKKPTETVTQKPTETSTQTEQPTETATAPAEVEKPAQIDITSLYFYGDATENSAEKLGFKNYLCRHYGIQFNIHAPARDMYIETINLRAVSGE